MYQNRRSFLKKSAVGGLASGLLTQGVNKSFPADSSSHKKNILFIIIEDLKAIMGCYGNPLVKTPNIDRLANRGVIFDHSYCQFPVCNPSHSSFLTGLRPDRTQILDNRKNRVSTIPNRTTLPRLFKENGYQTFGLGKVFHGRGEHDDPQAWDLNFDFRATQTGLRGEGRNLTDGEVKWCRWLAAEGDDLDQPDGQLAAKAVELLRERTSDPFFLTVGIHKPHDPFHAPKRYFDYYPLEHLIPPVIPKLGEPQPSYTIGSSWKKAFDRFTLQEEREFLRAYYACVTFMDAQVGKVLDELDRQELWEDTAVFFIGDHGYNLGNHDWWNKNVLFEESARVPMIAAVDGITPSAVRCSGIVELVDLYPTMAELSGIPIQEDLDGKSLLPLLHNPNQSWKQSAFTQVKRGEITGKSVRTARWRYTEWRKDGDRIGVELYDHASDPGEYRNLAEISDFESVIKTHRGLFANETN